MKMVKIPSRRINGGDIAIIAKIYIFAQKNMSMDNNKDKALKSPTASYGSKVRLGDIVPIPMENADETLRSMGYVTQEDLENHLSKYM